MKFLPFEKLMPFHPLIEKLIDFYEMKNYTNCWCEILHNDEKFIVRLMDYRDNYFSFFSIDVDVDTKLPVSLLLRDDEFEILWVGKNSEEEIFGIELEDQFKEIMNYRFDFGYSYCDCIEMSSNDEKSDYYDEEYEIPSPSDSENEASESKL